MIAYRVGKTVTVTMLYLLVVACWRPASSA